MRRVLAIAAVAWACQGCFVFDEIDKGRELMEQHSPKKSSDESDAAGGTQTASAAGSGDEAGFVERLRGWWSSRNEPAPPKRDPNDVVVRCQLGSGGAQFMRRTDCKLRGGRVI